MNYILLFLSFSFFICRKEDLKFKLDKIYDISKTNQIFISKNDYISFVGDNNLNNLFLKFSNKKFKNSIFLDSVEYSPYSSFLYCFKSLDENSSIIFWITEYELNPLVIAYFLEKGKLEKIGNLEILTPCTNCESLTFPISNVQIIDKVENIEISFVNDVNFYDSKIKKSKTYKPNDIKYVFNKVSKKTMILLKP